MNAVRGRLSQKNMYAQYEIQFSVHRASCHTLTAHLPILAYQPFYSATFLSRYQWGESTSEPNTFYFQEAYKGKAGFEAHTQAPHFAVWETFAGTDPFTAEPEVYFFETM